MIVFLTELVEYSDREKSNFLKALKNFQEYTLQSIPIVTSFLYKYMLIWDGEDYQEEIFGLLEWIEMYNEKGE